MGIARLAEAVGCCVRELEASSSLTLSKSLTALANSSPFIPSNNSWATCSHLLSSSSCDNPSVLAIKDAELAVAVVEAVVVDAGIDENFSLFLFLLCTGLNL